VIRHACAHRLRTVPLFQVARGVAAIRGRNLQRVVIVDMALDAGRRCVRAGEGKARDTMIERSEIRPRDRIVALRAVSHRKRGSRCRVRRIVGPLPGRQMATAVPAIGRRNLQVEIVIDVARLAGHVGMSTGERKADRRRGVIPHERRTEPGVKRSVAVFAS